MPRLVTAVLAAHVLAALDPVGRERRGEIGGERVDDARLEPAPHAAGHASSVTSGRSRR